jgi:hypothetical protein
LVHVSLICKRDIPEIFVTIFRAEEALKKNKKLIDSDQKEYQAVLQENYNTFKDKLSPLFTLNHPGRGGTGAINGSKTSSSPM